MQNTTNKKVTEFELNDRVNTYLINSGIEVGTIKRGDNEGAPFLKGKLGDKTGSVSFTYWNAKTLSTEELDSLINANVVYVEGSLSEYNGNLQLTVDAMRIAEEGEYDIKELLVYQNGFNELLVEGLSQRIEEINNPEVYKLARNIFDDHKQNFSIEPAAIGHHHNHLGGMAVHITQVVETALSLCDIYAEIMDDDVYSITRDYVIAGGILHDIGKFYEYKKNEYGYYTDITLEGAMLGHLEIGAEIIRDYARKLNIDKKIMFNIMAIINSHHTKQEWGAITAPTTIACVLVATGDGSSAQIDPYINEYMNQTEVVSKGRSGLGNKIIRTELMNE